MLVSAFQDYLGEDVTVSNFYAAILGDKDAIKGGSGKVVDSGPNDHIFIYYTDHGGPGVLGKFFLEAVEGVILNFEVPNSFSNWLLNRTLESISTLFLFVYFTFTFK